MTHSDRNQHRPRHLATVAEQRDGGTDRPHRRAEDVRRIVDSLPAMVAYWDAELRNRFANRAYTEFFGIEPEALRRMPLRELLGPELYELQIPHIERALNGEPQLFDRELTDVNGRSLYTQASYIPDVVDGKVVGFAVLVTDITARRAAELAREAAEARFSLAFKGSPVGMGLIDPDGRLTDVNPALCAMLGFPREELSGRRLGDLVEPASREQQHQRLQALFEDSSDPINAECRLVRKDSSPVWVLLSLSVVRDHDVLGIAHVQDITERKRFEEDLEAGANRLAEAERVAQMGSWEYDIAGDHLVWSPGLFSIHGLSPEEFDTTLSGGTEQRVMPDDRQFVRATVERAVAERGSFAMEYRVMRPDGRVRTLRSRGEVICDEDGEPARIVGIAQDITDTRLVEEALRSTAADLERRTLDVQKLALRAESQQPQAPLTARQLEVLRLIAQGKTSAEIADELVVTEGTVKWHVKQILAKTGASSRAEAVARVLGSDI